MLVRAAVHLVHRFVRVLAGWLFLADVFSFWGSLYVREHLLGVPVVLDDHAQGLLDKVLVQVRRSEHDQRTRPVERLPDARRLAQVQRPYLLYGLDQLLGQRVADARGLEAYDLQLHLGARVIDLQVQATALERLTQFPGPVRGQHDDRGTLSLDGPDLGYGNLVVGEELEQERLELLVGTVDLVQQQHRRRLGGYGLQNGPLYQEVLGEEHIFLLTQLRGGLAQALRRTEDLPDLLPQDLRVQELLAVLPLVERLGLVEALVPLQADERAVRGPCQRLRQLGLAHARGSLYENRLVQFQGQVDYRRQAPVADVLLFREPFPDLFDAIEQNAPFRERLALF